MRFRLRDFCCLPEEPASGGRLKILIVLFTEIHQNSPLVTHAERN
jgi:hypothetical protein